MDPNKAWASTFNAAITGLMTSKQSNQEPQAFAEHAVITAKAIADKAVQYHIQFAGTVHQSMQTDLAQQLQAQEAQPYRSTR